MNLILHAAGKHKKNAIDASELEFALDLWHSYVTNKSKIEEIFDKYDTNHSNKLEFDQLTRYLTDLNEGHAPKASPIFIFISFQVTLNKEFACHGRRWR